MSTTSMIRYDDLEKRQVKASAVEDQIIRLTHLIDNLLIMTKLESRSTAILDTVDISQVMQAVCKTIDKKYGHKVILNYDKPEKLVFVMGNEDDMYDAIEQILDNACRFASAGDVVVVTTKLEKDQIWINVRDTGHGISQEDMPYIFETFWRVDKAHSTPGFGLGLSIAKRIIELYQGRIEVESEEGAGSVFRIMFPITH